MCSIHVQGWKADANLSLWHLFAVEDDEDEIKYWPELSSFDH